MQEKAGEHGLAPAELERERCVAAVGAFRKRVESGEIGFPELPENDKGARAILRETEMLRNSVETVVVIGIGGSGLGAYALDAAIRGPNPLQSGIKKGRPRLVVLDNVDPGLIATAVETLNPKRTAACVIAKSGGTAETMSTFMVVHEWLTKALGRKAKQRIVAVTDPQKGDLRAMANDEGYLTFDVPQNVGGRFSVLSAVGLAPAAMTGLDILALLRGARQANAMCWSEDFERNLALQSAAVHHALDTKRGKKIEIVFSYSSYLWGSAFWYRQLWAESLGKRVDRKGKVVHTGQTPVAALGVTDQHSQVQLYMEGPNDKMITFWAVGEPRREVTIPKAKHFSRYDSTDYLRGQQLSKLFQAERRATESALTHAGRPNCRWMLPRVDEANMGAFFQCMEFQTAFAGELYGIDAFDQPGVELAKKLTNGLMGKKGFEKYAKEVDEE